MERLSNAGKLYLNEYYILSEARTDLERYLDSVVDQVYQMLLSKENDFTTSKFSWSVWQNKSTKGRIDVEFKAKGKLPFFREAKSDISVIYKDIRHFNKFTDPETIRISVWSPGTSKNVEQEIQQQGLNNYQKNIYEEIYVKLNLEDSSEAAEKISEHIIEKSELIFSIINEIVEVKK